MKANVFGIHQALRLYQFVGQHAYKYPKLTRGAFEKLADILPDYNTHCKYITTSINGLEAQWIVPKNCHADKVMLFIHGGGFATGSIHTHRAVASQIATEAGIKALTINYHLAPEYKFPTQINDTYNAYEFLLDIGFNPKNIVIAGESAGANLVAATLLKIRDNKQSQPATAILLSAWLDLTMSGDSIKKNRDKDPMLPYKGLHLWATNYAGKNNLSNAYVSPLWASLNDLCPIFMQVGECEVLLDDSIRFAEKIKAAGGEVKLEIWNDMFHAWQGFWMILPEGREANENIGKYIKEKLKIKTTTAENNSAKIYAS